jgi:hypothetical protein
MEDFADFEVGKAAQRHDAMFAGVHARPLARANAPMSNEAVERMSVGGEIGADLVEIAQSERAHVCEEFLAAVRGSARVRVWLAAGPAEAEVGLMRHQEGDKPDPENRAKEHAGHPNFLLSARKHARLTLNNG